MLTKHGRFAAALSGAVLGLAALPAGAAAYTNWDDPSTTEADWCATCHGEFRTSASGDPHDIHNAQITNCLLCHMTGGDSPQLGASMVDATGTSPGDSCSGCHGRVDSTSGDSEAYGLRAAHAGMGVTICGDCHTDPAPQPEDVNPLNYGGTLTTVDSACNELGSEDWDGDGAGLDNDGDGDYDLADSDCVAFVDAGVPDAGVDAGLADAGLLDAGLADAGSDAGPAEVDAGPAEVDAGVADAGFDAGAPLDGGADRDAAVPSGGGDDDGCDCSTPGTGSRNGGALAALLVVGALLTRLRRRRG